MQSNTSSELKLHTKGLTTGKYSIENDSTGGSDNQLTLYLIFNNDFDAELTAKAFDKKGLETGRTKLKANQVKRNTLISDLTNECLWK